MHDTKFLKEENDAGNEVSSFAPTPAMPVLGWQKGLLGSACESHQWDLNSGPASNVAPWSCSQPQSAWDCTNLIYLFAAIFCSSFLSESVLGPS